MRFAFLLLPFLFIGCTTLSAGGWEDHYRVRLTRDSLTSLEGTYSYYGDALQCETEEGTLCPRGFFIALSYMSPVREAEPADSTARLVLSVRDPRHVTATVYVDGAVVSEGVLEGRVNHRGYFEVDPIRRLKFRSFIPIWAVVTQKAQIGVDSTGALLLEHATGGLGFFTVFPLLGTTFNYTYVFPSLEAMPK